MNKIARMVCIGTCIVLLFAAAAFTMPVSEDPERTTSGSGILTLANRDDPLSGFDTLRTSSIALHHVAGAIFGPGNLVMRCRENMYIVCPCLAESWSNNPDFTEWSFVIRKGVYWHDGTVFTAEDAKFWFDLVFFGAESGGKVRAPAYFANELGPVDKVEVRGTDFITITFKQRNEHFLEILANPRFRIAHPRHLMQPRIDAGEVSVSPEDVGLVGLGPFQIMRYDRGSLISVKRFDRYWERDVSGESLPYLAGIDFIIMPDPFAMDAAFRSGRLDGGARGQGHYLTQERMDRYIADLGDEVYFARTEGGNFRLAFNMLKEGPWQDARVRRAIALWIDKRAAIPIALGGFGWTTPELGPPDIPVPRHFVNWPKFDRGSLEEKREEAKRLIAEAGYPDGFSMDHLTRGLNTAGGEFLKDQLSGLGIDLRLRIVDEGEWNTARVSLDYDTQQGRLTPSPIPEGTESVYGRYSSNPDAYAKHEDQLIDDKYRRLREALTFERRVTLWRDLERYLFVEQTYIIPIAESIDVIPYRSYVKGLPVPTEDSHTHTDFATVRIEGK